MRKNIHVRLEYEEALESKKQILSAQANILEILKRLKTYQNLRRQELILKNNLKKEFFAFRHEINNTNACFPEVDSEETVVKKRKIQKLSETKRSKDIEFQLKDIQDKLARLG